MGSLRPDRMIYFWDHWEREPDQKMKDFWVQHRTVESVHCWTFHQLLERHRLDHVDLLQIDAEGYDYEILRTIDFSRLRPRFINYERVLLHEDEPACRAMLTDAGYVLFDWSVDTLAVALEATVVLSPSKPPGPRSGDVAGTRIDRASRRPAPATCSAAISPRQSPPSSVAPKVDLHSSAVSRRAAASGPRSGRGRRPRPSMTFSARASGCAREVGEALRAERTSLRLLQPAPARRAGRRRRGGAPPRALQELGRRGARRGSRRLTGRARSPCRAGA